MQQRIIIGRIGKPHGIRGWVHVYSYTDPIENITQFDTWEVEHKGTWTKMEIEFCQSKQGKCIAKLKGISLREEALNYRNALIAVDRKVFAPLNPGEYYWVDLVGCDVYQESGSKLGKVASFLETGANDVMVVQAENEKDLLIPFVRNKYILSIDLQEKRIVVFWSREFL